MSQLPPELAESHRRFMEINRRVNGAHVARYEIDGVVSYVAVETRVLSSSNRLDGALANVKMWYEKARQGPSGFYAEQPIGDRGERVCSGCGQAQTREAWEKDREATPVRDVGV